MKRNTLFSWNFRSISIALLIALALCCRAFCDEIHDAARDGDLQKVKALVQQNAELVSSKDEDGKTPLHWAAANGHKDVVEFLLENKADAHAKDNDGDTPIDLAAFHKDVADLLSRSAAANSTANSSSTHDPAIFDAIRNSDLDKVKTLVEDDPGIVSSIDNHASLGTTPLDLAAMAGQTAIVEYLLDHHSDINAKNVQNETPLMDAAYGDQKDIVKLLLAKGANVNAVNSPAPHGWTALHFAAARGYNDIAGLLLAAKVNVSIIDFNGWTALHYAADEMWGGPEQGYVDVAQSLLANGADINASSNYGDTPLHIAARRGNTAIAAFLIANGANVSATDKRGQTPLHIAMDQGVKGRDIAALLTKHGATY